MRGTSSTTDPTTTTGTNSIATEGLLGKKLDEKINAVDEFEPLIEEVRDPSVYYEQEIDRSNQWEYEALCQKFVKL